MIDRMDRVAKLLRMEISIILQEEVNDPRVSAITITDIEITRDMRLAKVYYVPATGDEDDKKAIRKGLKSAAKFLRGEIARRMSMKYTPRFSFREDLTEQNQRKVDELFARIEDELGVTPEETEEGPDNENRRP